MKNRMYELREMLDKNGTPITIDGVGFVTLRICLR